MAGKVGGKIVTSGLVLALDAANRNSYRGTGTSWLDLSGNNNNGTLTNFGATPFSNINGGAIVLDGTDDYVNCGNATSIRQTTNDFTISVWVKISSTQSGSPTWRPIITSKNALAAAAGYGLVWNNSLNQFLWSTANGTTAVEILSTNTWASVIDRWTNVVVIRQNGATNNGHFYINSVYESLVSSATVVNVTTSTNMTIGNTADLYGPYWFTGTYGIVQIYNRALSASEVLQNFNATKTRFGL